MQSMCLTSFRLLVVQISFEECLRVIIKRTKTNRLQPCHQNINYKSHFDKSTVCANSNKYNPITIKTEFFPNSSKIGSTNRSGSDRKDAGPWRCRFTGGNRRTEAPQVSQGHHAQHAGTAGPQPGHDQPVLGQCPYPATSVLHHRYVQGHSMCSKVLNHDLPFWFNASSLLHLSIYCIPVPSSSTIVLTISICNLSPTYEYVSLETYCSLFSLLTYVYICSDFKCIP